ncbi:MAG: ABC transporter ATP-binding protein [Clostridia bacterium]|nr:ABC transporter ATP-binding protein [Clostridia bacterium]
MVENAAETVENAAETVENAAEAVENAAETVENAAESAETNASGAPGNISGEDSPKGSREILVSVSHVTREFTRKDQKIVAVNDVSLEVEKGSFVILMGKSGSGKTTLLNLIAAIDMPTSGSVSFEGRDYASLGEKGRDNLRRVNMGIVFQNTALMSNMSAIENVEFALSIAGIHSEKRRKSSITWLEKMGIRDRRNHMPAEMSGGEQARVAIGRALAHSPKLLLADEPTAELDTNTSFEVVKMFRDLVDHENLTIVMTTHDVNIMGNADIIYTLEDGRVADVRKN